MKSCLINPVGLSPMIITELYRYLRNTEKDLRDVVIIHTNSRDVISGSKVAVASILTHYEDARVQLKPLSSDDIRSSDDLYDFLRTVVDIMQEERDKYKVKRFYLNATGGRKIQTIALSIFAGILGISEVYNIVDQNVQNVNEQWERERHEADNFYGIDSTDELKNMYIKLGEEFDSLFYPDVNTLEFIKVPVIIMPEEERNYLKKLIVGISIDDEDCSISKLRAYQESGLITFDKNRTYGTELGGILLNYIR